MTRFFIDRPIFSWVISIVILLGGAVAGFVLPIAQYPDITPPTVSVTAIYPGANASVVADSVAAPIEQQISGVDKMLYMSSQCTNDGAYTLTVTFELGTDPNMNQVLVQNRVSLAMPQLPQPVQVQGVTTKKKSPSILLVVNLISPDGRYDDLYLSNYATVYIKDELLRLKGVGDVTYLGQRDYSMRVWLDPEKMAAKGLSATDVLTAIQKQNVQVAAGQIGQQPVPRGQDFQYTMSTLGRLDEIKQFQDILIKSGSTDKSAVTTPVVRVRDVARVELGAQQYDQIAQLSGLPTVGLAVYQLPGSNALDVAKAIKNRMKELKKRFPKGIDYRIVYDTTPFVEQSVEEVINTLRDAVILVALVVLFFLQDWKAMILPMIDVPVSLIGTLAVMALLGFSLNNLTLFGLVLAIGIVVDDAIVVLENIERLIATGLPPREATIQAMAEITGPIIAITLVLISVFLPAAFLPGISGQFYRQFALTIASAMVISAINAMTLTPSRAVAIFKTEQAHHGGHEMQREALPWWIFALIGGVITIKLGKPIVAPWMGVPLGEEAAEAPSWLRWSATAVAFLPGMLAGGVVGWLIIKPVNSVLGRFFRGFNRLFDAISHGYGRAMAGMVRVSLIVLVLYVGLLFLTYRTMSKAPTGFIPMQDQGYLLVNVQLPDSASVQRTQEVMARIQRIALGDEGDKYQGLKPGPKSKRYEGIPGIANTVSVAGMSFLLNANGSNFGSCFLVLEPFEKRKGKDELYDDVVAQKFREAVAQDVGQDAVITVFRAPPIQGLGSAGGFKLQVEQRGFVDLNELQETTDDFVRAANKDPRLVGVFSLYRARTPQKYVDIDRTRCEEAGLDFQEVFNTLQVYMGGAYVNLFNKFGRTWQVNLMADQRFRTDTSYMRQLKMRNRDGKMVPLGSVAAIKENAVGPVMVMRYNTYTSAAVNGNTAAGVSSGDSIKILDDLAKELRVTFEWTELTFLEIQAGSSAIFVFLLGSLLVFLVLSAQYESWSLPLAVILVVPMCLLCAVTGMLIVRLPVDIFVQIGFLVLVGLAAKNAILIVEFARQRQHEAGLSAGEAAVDAARVRLRPIIMTSFAFILGVVPLVMGEGAGAEMRRSLGTAVFAGMIGVTAFGLILTPVFYSVVIGLTGAGIRAAPPTTPAAPPEAKEEAAVAAAKSSDGAITTAEKHPR
jgi:multidrug efflux pump